MSLRFPEIFVVVSSPYPQSLAIGSFIRGFSLELGQIHAVKMATLLLGGKKLTDFRVVDLRQELEKRGLEKSGVKAVLIERLEKVKL